MKWLEAIHKTSKKRVSAWKIMEDLEWQGKDKDEFIAPEDLIENFEEVLANGKTEVKLIFVHYFKRYEGTEQEENVTSHFRSEDGSLARLNSWGESDEHKLAKKYIYDNIDNISLINFENKKIKDVGEIEDIKIEKGIGLKRADVLVIFKNYHPVLGRGIAFEVQYSSQEEEKIIIRSFDRASYGYSVVWLWSKDLKNFTNSVKVTPYNQALKEYNEMTTYLQNNELSNIAEKARRLTSEIRKEIIDAIVKNKIIFEDIRSFYQSEELYARKKELISETIQEITDAKEINIKEYNNYKKSLDEEINKLKLDIEQQLKTIVTNSINNEILNNIISEKINKFDISELIIKQKRICPSCGSKLHEYKNGDLICEGCPYHRLNEKYYESQNKIS